MPRRALGCRRKPAEASSTRAPPLPVGWAAYNCHLAIHGTVSSTVPGTSSVPVLPFFAKENQQQQQHPRKAAMSPRSSLCATRPAARSPLALGSLQAPLPGTRGEGKRRARFQHHSFHRVTSCGRERLQRAALPALWGHQVDEAPEPCKEERHTIVFLIQVRPFP